MLEKYDVDDLFIAHISAYPNAYSNNKNVDNENYWTVLLRRKKNRETKYINLLTGKTIYKFYALDGDITSDIKYKVDFITGFYHYSRYDTKGNYFYNYKQALKAGNRYYPSAEQQMIKEQKEQQLIRQRRDAHWIGYYGYYCFVAGTKIVTENGYKNIEDITTEDLVQSYNFNTNNVELKKVTTTIINNVNEIMKIVVGNTIIETTPYHTFYVNKEWMKADNIKKGDILISIDNKEYEVESVEKEKLDDQKTVYNFTVDENHNYYVSEMNILVHNESVF